MDEQSFVVILQWHLRQELTFDGVALVAFDAFPWVLALQQQRDLTVLS